MRFVIVMSRVFSKASSHYYLQLPSDHTLLDEAWQKQKMSPDRKIAAAKSAIQKNDASSESEDDRAPRSITQRVRELKPKQTSFSSEDSRSRSSSPSFFKKIPDEKTDLKMKPTAQFAPPINLLSNQVRTLHASRHTSTRKIRKTDMKLKSSKINPMEAILEDKLHTNPQTWTCNVREISKKGKLINRKISCRIMSNGKAADQKDKFVCESLKKKCENGTLLTLKHVRDALKGMETEKKYMDFTSYRLHDGQGKLFKIEAGLLSDTLLKLLLEQQKISSQGREWQIYTESTEREVLLKGVGDLCQHFNNLSLRQNAETPGNNMSNMKVVKIQRFAMKNEFWYHDDQKETWKMLSRQPDTVTKLETVQFEHLELAQKLRKAYDANPKHTTIKIGRVDVNANIQQGTLIQIAENITLKCSDVKTRRLSAAEACAVRKRIVVFSNGGGGAFNLKFDRSRKAGVDETMVELDKAEFFDLYKALEYELSKNKTAKSLHLRGPRVMWGKDIAQYAKTPYVKIKDKIFILDKFTEKQWHAAELQNLFGHTAIYNEMRQNHPSTIKDNAVFMNKNLRQRDMVEFKDIINTFQSLFVKVWISDVTDDSQVIPNSERNKIFNPLIVSKCQDLRQNPGNTKLPKEILNILQLMVCQNLEDMAHRQEEFNKEELLRNAFAPHASVDKRNFYDFPGVSVLDEKIRENVCLFKLGHRIDYVQKMREMSFDSLTHKNTGENRLRILLQENQVKPLTETQIMHISEKQQELLSKLLVQGNKCTQEFLLSKTQKEIAKQTGLAANEIRYITCLDQELALVQRPFKVEYKEKNSNQNVVRVSIQKDTINKKEANVLAFEHGDPIMNCKIADTVFANFALEMKNVGANRPKNMQEFRDKNLNDHILAGKTKFSTDELNNFQIVKPEINTCLKVQNNFYIVQKADDEHFWQLSDEVKHFCVDPDAKFSDISTQLAHHMKAFAWYRGSAIEWNHASIIANCKKIDSLSEQKFYLPTSMQMLLENIYARINRRKPGIDHSLNVTANTICQFQPDHPRLVNKLLESLDAAYEADQSVNLENTLKNILSRKQNDFEYCIVDLDNKQTMLDAFANELKIAVDLLLHQPHSFSLSQHGLTFLSQPIIKTLHKICALSQFSTGHKLVQQDWQNLFKTAIPPEYHTHVCNMIISNATAQRRFLTEYMQIINWTESVLSEKTPWPSLTLYNEYHVKDDVVVHEIAVKYYNSITKDLGNFELLESQNYTDYIYRLLRGYFWPFDKNINDVSDMTYMHAPDYEKTLFLCTRENGNRGTFNALMWPVKKPLLKLLIELDLVEILKFLWPLSQNFIESFEGGKELWIKCIPALWNSVYYYKSNRCLEWFTELYKDQIPLLEKCLYENPEKAYDKKISSDTAKYEHLIDRSQQSIKRRKVDGEEPFFPVDPTFQSENRNAAPWENILLKDNQVIEQTIQPDAHQSKNHFRPPLSQQRIASFTSRPQRRS